MCQDFLRLLQTPKKNIFQSRRRRRRRRRHRRSPYYSISYLFFFSWALSRPVVVLLFTEGAGFSFLLLSFIFI